MLRAATSRASRCHGALGHARIGAARTVRQRLSPFVTAAKSSDESDAAAPPAELSAFDKLMGPQTGLASAAQQANAATRWLMALPAFATHACIGSPWAWSAMSPVLCREHGVVTSAAADWTMYEATMPMAIAFTFQGLGAAGAGKWQMRVGTRMAMATAGCCFGGGLLIGAAAVQQHSLALLYLGYGVLGGTGVGVAYTPPLQTLIAWMPDRKGVASGLVICGFGGAGLIFAQLSGKLVASYAQDPTFVGALGDVETTTNAGSLFAKVGDGLKEVVLATHADISNLGRAGELAEGYYVVGSGNTGAASALAVLGGGYLATMLASAFLIRRPDPGFAPAGWTPPAAGSGEGALAGNVNVDSVMKTPQFWLLGTTFFCMATGGMGVMSVAKPMMGEIFGTAVPFVTAAFAGQYLLMLSAANLGGRIGWASASDVVGRRRTFQLFTVGSLPLYAMVPAAVGAVMTGGSNLGVYAFMGSTIAAISVMGGTYAILPAYEADIFGAKHVGAIHGRMLLGSTAAALAGPQIILKLRERSVDDAIDTLMADIEPHKFEALFGAGMDQKQDLLDAKTITIDKLVSIAPEGTVDPSPFLYDTTMFTMAGLMAVAAVAHQMVKPVDGKYFEKAE